MAGAPPPRGLGRAIHARFAALGGVELELPERGRTEPRDDFAPSLSRTPATTALLPSTAMPLVV